MVPLILLFGGDVLSLCQSMACYVMKRLLLFVFVLTAVSLMRAQVPQFTSADYAGWIYNNPVIYLNEDNILANRIVLYTTSTGQDLTLTSPVFACGAGQIIDLQVTWVTTQWQDEAFDKSKVALTAALIGDDGMAVDSVTYDFATISKTNHVKMSLDVPRSMSHARLRFASWKADVNSNGAIRQILTASWLPGDVNLDGEVSLADINAIMSVILGGDTGADLSGRADVNRDGEVGIADVNRVIDLILN